MKRIIWGIMLSVLVAGSANAALLSRAGGQAYYDTVLDITWVADANLAKTSGYDSAGLTGFSLPDYPDGGISRNDSEGRISWPETNTWITLLNTANHLGVNDWRLPRVVDETACAANLVYDNLHCGMNVLTKSGDIYTYEVGQTVYSEMAHLYYVTLGDVARRDVSGNLTGCDSSPPYCLTNTGPFSNIQPGGYWADNGYVFGFDAGAQGGTYFLSNSGYYFGFYAWPVRDGDIGAVPVPGALWLFGTGLALLGTTMRRRCCVAV